MHPTVVISSRGEERLQSGHPWIYRADVANVHAAAGDIVQIRSPRGRTLGSALYSDRSQIALRLLSYGDTPADLALIRRRLESAIAFRRSLAIDATRVSAGARRSGPPAVADRRPLRRLPGRSDAVAGDGSAAAGDLTPMLAELLQPRGILARNDPRARVARRARAAGRGRWPATCRSP